VDHRSCPKALSGEASDPPGGVPSAVCDNRVRLLPSTSQQVDSRVASGLHSWAGNVYVTHIGCGTTTEASPVELDALVGIKRVGLSQRFEEASCALVNTCSHNTGFGGLERR
jgi:hypothetical protein